MTDVTAEFDAHERFEGSDDTYTPVTNDWDATAAVDGDDVHLTVTVPTLDAVVESETVAPVVEDGWFETFELRVEDAPGVTNADVAAPTVERLGDEVRVETTVTPRPGKAPDDTLAVVNYVEGTWFEGVVPGYDYAEKVQAMRERAHQNAQEKQGTPL